MGVKETFGEKLRTLREERGYGVRECAAKLEISHASLINYEKGERAADIEFCKRVADLFEVSGDYLLGLSDERR